MAEKWIRIGEIATLVLILSFGVYYFQATGKSDICTKGGIRANWIPTALPYRYYCPVENKTEWCSHLTSYAEPHAKCHTLKLINYTSPTLKKDLTEYDFVYYDSKDKSYTLVNPNLSIKTKIALKSPERMPCSGSCYGIIEIFPENSFLTNKNDFYLKFFSESQEEITRGNVLYDWKIEKFVGYEPLVYPNYTYCYNSTNHTNYICGVDYYEHPSFTREVYEDWNFQSSQIDVGESFILKISGNKDPKAVIDWRLTFLNYTLEEFAWWDTEEVLTEYNNTALASDQWNTESSDRRYLAQTFNHSLGADYNLSHIGLYMIKRAPNGNASMEIWNTFAGEPDSKVYDCKDLVPGDIVSDNTNTWVIIDCTTEGGYPLETNTNYAVVLYDVAGGSTDHRWGMPVDRTDSTYANGSFYYDDDGAIGTWTEPNGGDDTDAIFTIWGVAPTGPSLFDFTLTDQSTISGQSGTYDINCSDGTITYGSNISTISCASFINETNGTFFFMPDYSSIGAHLIEVNCTNLGGTNSSYFNWTVSECTGVAEAVCVKKEIIKGGCTI